MKKFIKISLLILFIIFVLGITTSNVYGLEGFSVNLDLDAYTVNDQTTASEMINILNDKNNPRNLTGIRNEVRDRNKYLYCREWAAWLYGGAEYNYSIVNGKKVIYTYPGNYKDGYARAYILAAGDYDKSDNINNGGIPTKDDERQWAWYCIDGQINDYNDLYNIAIEYQNYKIQEKALKDKNGGKVIALVEPEKDEDKPKTILVEDKIIYGPIKINYLYKKAKSGSAEDEWGGFDYAFFDEKNNNISSKVKLCTLSGENKYEEIKSTEIKTTGYYKVSTDLYTEKNLYITTTEKNISNIKAKFQVNQVDYEATIYELEGIEKRTSSGRSYCSNCWFNVVNDPAEAIQNPNKYVSRGGVFYKYVAPPEYKEKQRIYICNYYCFGDVMEYAGDATLNGTLEVYKGYNGIVYSQKSSAIMSFLQMAYGKWTCLKCSSQFNGNDSLGAQNHASTHVTVSKASAWDAYIYKFVIYTGCGKEVYGKGGSFPCGHPYNPGEAPSQGLTLVEDKKTIETTNLDLEINIELSASIEVTKKWNDANDVEKVRPNDITLKVYRSTDKTNWTELRSGTDYTITWSDKEGSDWKAIITGLQRMDGNNKDYYFKVIEDNVSVNYKVTYKSGENTDGIITGETNAITITNTKLIEIGGYVWLDEQTGEKPALPYNGIKETDENPLAGIPVHLYYKDPTTNKFIKIDKNDKKTDENGQYIFEKLPIGIYYVEFEYDGINYEDTLANEDSKASEVGRADFNGRFNTISYGGITEDGKVFGKSNDGTTLEYNYSEIDRKSTLVTSENGIVKSKFIMKAVTAEEKHVSSVDNLNLGLVKRGTDLALSTDLFDAKVTINGQETDYEYNKKNNNITIGTSQSSESENGEVSYSLSLYESDYNYRIRDYVSNNEFKEKNYTGQTVPKDPETGKYLIQTGAQLEFYVTYKLNLQNQSGSGRDVDTGEDIITTINEVTYDYDAKYTFNEDKTKELNAITFTDDENILTVKNVTLGPWETKTIYLVFNVKDEFIGSEEKFTNKAEITSYSTSKGLIDVDSQPANFINANQIEDDNDTAGGLGIIWGEKKERKITGKVFDGNNNVNDVIVQLIELKEITKEDETEGETKVVYEYIWQETVSGTGTGKRLTADGKALETYTYTKSDGHYEFKGFIPGDYIVRFIYGDGTTYDLTENVIKYNGQDYKSVADSNYKAEWYNSSSYSKGASVARDNEARRLETMAYSVDINIVKGLLLKLLNNPTVDDLNKTEKNNLVLIYNGFYDPDISEVTAENITKLLKEQVLKNTWMCAETSKIKVAVDTEDTTNTNASTTVNGSSTSYVNNISDINLGLELRPATKIELKKYITGFKLTAANGQTLVNAHVDVKEYLNGTMDSNKVQGIKDHVTILDNLWQYEVVPTDINTIIDGANLEFEYTLVVKNTGDTDYLSKTLADEYTGKTISEYKEFLTNKANTIKTAMRSGTSYSIGELLGSSYYVGGTGANKVLTQVTSIRDYVNNNLDFISGTKPDGTAIDINSCSDANHRILRDDYSMQDISVKYISTGETGKMENGGKAELYTITLGKNPISSTGNLEFDTYIAEVMSYTNAAGRRDMDSTPGNAEIIQAYPNDTVGVHEDDEADTGRIQIGVATGEDQKSNYIIITTVVAGIALIAAGAFAVKKYVIK